MTATLYFEDLAPEQRYSYGSTTVSAEAIKIFARKYDPQPFHLDEAAARDSIFKELAASGWHTAALTVKLLTRDAQRRIASLGSPGFDNLRWLKPVRAGDTLSVRTTCLEAIPSKTHPGRGTVRLYVETLNRADEVVMSMEFIVLVARRPD